MNLMHLPTFDDALADSMKLAEVRRVVSQAMGFAEHQLGKIREPIQGTDYGSHYAMNAGMLEATVEILIAYLGQIAGTCKPDDYLPFDDDLSDETQDDWHDQYGNVDANGAYDAAGHHFAERDSRIGCDLDEWAESASKDFRYHKHHGGKV